MLRKSEKRVVKSSNREYIREIEEISDCIVRVVYEKVVDSLISYGSYSFCPKTFGFLSIYGSAGFYDTARHGRPCVVWTYFSLSSDDVQYLN